MSWSETGEDAEHPAPVLYVNDAPAADEHDAAAVTRASTMTTRMPQPPRTDVLARVLGIGGLVVGIVGLVVAITARRKAAK